jgi:phospholipid/cholesterol/gamma-HCH transport system substrate-binding protein
MRSRAIREGSVGLFALLGLFLIGGLVIWLRGDRWNQQGYQLVVNFEDVSGLQLGAPVNYRGVRVGKITKLVPGSNNVQVTLEIDDSDLKIPPDVEIQANRYGLIGEASVDITPKSSLSPQALQVDPNSEECEDKDLILCNQDKLDGVSGSQLVGSLTRLSEAYSDPEFLANLNATAANAAVAGKKIARLSDEMSLVAKTARQEIQEVSETLESIQGAANQATSVMANLDATVATTRNDLQRTVRETGLLMENLNGVVTDNRSNIQRTILSVEKSSNELQRLVANLDYTITQVNTGLASVDTPEIARNFEQILADTRQTSGNLRQLSETLNDPTTITILMKTLDSARVTFENTQKITSDVEEIIGDPELRENLRKMINGLSDLVSSTQQLEQQIITLERLQQKTSSPSLRLTPFAVQPEITSIDPKTARYQILSPQDLENRRLLTRKKEE